MELDDYRILFLVVGSILVLVAALPGLYVLLPSFGEDYSFSEFWLLGPGHMAEDYPYNVRGGVNYTMYVGVENHMGSSSYYSVRVKFRNQSEPLPQMQPEEPDDTGSRGTPSPLPVLYEYQVVLEDGGEWEAPLNFSYSGFSSNEDQCRVENLRINDFYFPVNKTGTWNLDNQGFYYQIFVELWIYDVESGDFQFHNRFVTKWLNMTSA